MLGKILVAIAVLSGTGLGLLISMTTPASAGAFGVLCVFLLVYLLLVSLGTFALYGLSRCIAAVMRVVASARPLERLSLQHAYYYATVLAIAPVVLVSIASVGAVGLPEIGLVLAFELIGCVYITKRLPG